MIGIDTNVLVRFLTGDDPRQAETATEWIQAAIKKEEKFFLNRIVLCELVWVLSGSYGFPKSRIVETLEELLSTEHLIVDDDKITFAALEDYASSNVDFADCLIGRGNEAKGCSTTLTFDRKLWKTGMFRGEN